MDKVIHSYKRVGCNPWPHLNGGLVHGMEEYYITQKTIGVIVYPCGNLIWLNHVSNMGPCMEDKHQSGPVSHRWYFWVKLRSKELNIKRIGIKWLRPCNFDSAIYYLISIYYFPLSNHHELFTNNNKLSQYSCLHCIQNMYHGWCQPVVLFGKEGSRCAEWAAVSNRKWEI